MKTAILSFLLLYLFTLNMVIAQTFLNTFHSLNNFSKMNSTKSTFSEEDHPCEQRTSMLLKYFLNQSSEIPSEYSDYYKFFIFSGTSVNDYGDYRGCKKLNISQYSMLSYNITTSAANITVRLGLCYFKECDINYMNKAKGDLVKLINKTLSLDIDTESLIIYDPQQKQEDNMDKNVIGLSIVVSVIGMLIVLNILQCYSKTIKSRKGSLLYDVDEERRSSRKFLDEPVESPPSPFHKILLFFDFFKNASKICEIKNPNETFKALRIFDGIRIFCTFWVVYGHTFFVPLNVGFKNTSDIPYLVTTWRYSTLITAPVAVDVFFYMAGFMLYYSLQKYFNKNIKNKFKIICFAIINRYFRLLPLYLFIIFGITYIVPFIGSGPIYENVVIMNQSCKKFFWHNLLYFNNLIDYSKDGGMCAGHTWYLANDMQFFVLSIFIFILFNKQKLIRNIIFSLIFLGSNAVSIFLVYKYNYRFFDITHPSENSSTFFDNFYIKPYIRICPYILGLYFCEFFLESPVYKADNSIDQNKNNPSVIFKINQYLISSTWASSLVFIISLVFIFFNFYATVLINNEDLPLYAHAIFATFNKVLFILGLGSIVHLTFLGRLKIIYEFLSFPAFTVISRITYGVYLIHMYILCYFYFSFDALTYVKMGDYFFVAVGVFTLTTATSFFMSLLLESPVVNAIKVLLESKKK